jgi:hypothetical protein
MYLFRQVCFVLVPTEGERNYLGKAFGVNLDE